MTYEDATLVFQRGNTPDASRGKLVDSVASVENVKFANIDQIYKMSICGFVFADVEKFSSKIALACVSGWMVCEYA